MNNDSAVGRCPSCQALLVIALTAEGEIAVTLDAEATETQTEAEATTRRRWWHRVIDDAQRREAEQPEPPAP